VAALVEEPAAAWVVELQAEERQAGWAAPARAARDWAAEARVLRWEAATRVEAALEWEAAAWEAALEHPEEEAAVPAIPVQG
jgi:hypothetical protein